MTSTFKSFRGHRGGWHKVVAAAPRHVQAVRRIVLDPLTKAQDKQLREISTRINQAADEQEPQGR